MAKLDRIDRIILQNLQKNGRITNVELAKTVGISAPPCLRRLKCMEKNNIIVGYHAELNYEAVGYNMRAICIVSLLSQSSSEITAFLTVLKTMKNIMFCFSTPGNEEFVLYIVAKDLNEYEKILQDTIQNTKRVAKITTYVLSNKHAENFVLQLI
jgi:DNA-binding Lrp family transcriptional regulator